jgi:ABC-type multidrug transport system ATPase subunit
MKAIETQHLSMRYKKAYAMIDINIDVQEGEFLALVGHNGVGKTTLLRLMGGLQKPSDGQVYLFGRAAKHIKDINQLVGIVHQATIISDYLTVREYLRTEARLRGLPRGTVSKHLYQMDLADLSHRRIKDLSIGSKRKILIIKAIMHEPRILLLDEPTAGLDPIIRRWIWDYLKGLKQHRISCVFSTHSLDEITSLCDKVLLMRKRDTALEYKLVELAEEKQNEVSIEFKEMQAHGGDLVASFKDTYQDAYWTDHRITIKLSDDPYQAFPAILNELIEKRMRFKSVSVNSASIEDILINYCLPE